MSDALTPEAFAAKAAVSRETCERLALHLDLLRRWQQRINLVGRSTLTDPWRRHMLDSAQLAPLLPERARVADLGSGAGFPGLVLAIVRGGPVHLIESDGRKAAFLCEAARVTDAPAEVHASRAEGLALAVDVVVARACAPLDRLLSEMAKNAPRNAEMAPMQPGEGRTVDRDELQSMVERLRELWEAGAREAAMDLLAELQNMLENMRMAEMSEGQASRNAQTMRMLQELQRLARDQHRLLDRTFREGNQAPYGAQQAPQNDGPPGGRSGRQAGAGRSWEGMSDLRAAQQRLRRRLGEFGRRLGERFGSVPGAFGKAGMSMRDAAGLLGAGEREPAMEAQGRALEELRQAGAELMRNLAREGGRRAGPGSRDPARTQRWRPAARPQRCRPAGQGRPAARPAHPRRVAPPGRRGGPPGPRARLSGAAAAPVLSRACHRASESRKPCRM